jgi:hypothetical protein
MEEIPGGNPGEEHDDLGDDQKGRRPTDYSAQDALEGLQDRADARDWGRVEDGARVFR